MKISKVQLTNFKRFTDLTIDKIPESSKLVLLIGSNGSGKSSVFDAFDWLSKGAGKGVPQDWRNYYNKIQTLPHVEPTALVELQDGRSINKTGLVVSEGQELVQRFIGRSSIRIVPRILNQADPRMIDNDTDSPTTYIENDTRFINDVFAYIQEINNAVREPIFQGKSSDTVKIFNDFIAPFNNSLLNIFGGNEKTTIKIIEFKDASPATNAKLIFQKGDSKINYDLLSHGEKQVVILLLNFIVRRRQYEDAIIFIDEMDCHLNTSLQERLLDEIVNVWIPDSSQLWTASHALGFINYANKSEQASIIDFNLFDFDIKQEIYPSEKEHLDLYYLAIPKAMLANLPISKKIFCEHTNDAYYNLLSIPDTVFTGVRDSKDVFLNVKRDNRYHSLRDRDFISDVEIERIETKYKNHHILRYYNFENYIYHPDNIAEINPPGFDKDDYISEIRRQKGEKHRYISPTIVDARKTYEEFKTDSQLKDKDINSIADDFADNDFEKFYKFFDMKQQFNKTYLSKFNLSKEALANTKWFKSKIVEVLGE